MLNILGIDLDKLAKEVEDVEADSDQLEEFREFDARKEPSLSTKNTIYSLHPNAHFDRKRNLEKEFGRGTTASDDLSDRNNLDDPTKALNPLQAEQHRRYKVAADFM